MNKMKIGKIVGTHALKGELKIRSTSDFSEERFQVGNCISIAFEKEMQELKIIKQRVHKGNYLVTFKDHKDINMVEKYIGCFVYADKDESLLEEDEYYTEDLIGTQVYLEDGSCIGEIKDVLFNGRHDVLMIEGSRGKVSIPYVDAFVIEEDISNHRMVVKVIPGMLHEN